MLPDSAATSKTTNRLHQKVRFEGLENKAKALFLVLKSAARTVKVQGSRWTQIRTGLYEYCLPSAKSSLPYSLAELGGAPRVNQILRLPANHEYLSAWSRFAPYKGATDQEGLGSSWILLQPIESCRDHRAGIGLAPSGFVPSTPFGIGHRTELCSAAKLITNVFYTHNTIKSTKIHHYSIMNAYIPFLGVAEFSRLLPSDRPAQSAGKLTAQPARPAAAKGGKAELTLLQVLLQQALLRRRSCCQPANPCRPRHPRISAPSRQWLQATSLKMQRSVTDLYRVPRMDAFYASSSPSPLDQLSKKWIYADQAKPNCAPFFPLASRLHPSFRKEVLNKSSLVSAKMPQNRQSASAAAAGMNNSAAGAAAAPPGSQEWAVQNRLEAARQLRNQKRAERRKKRRIQGAYFPHSEQVNAGTEDNPRSFSLFSWRICKQVYNSKNIYPGSLMIQVHNGQTEINSCPNQRISLHICDYCMLQKAMKIMVQRGINNHKSGIDTSKFTLDQFKFVDDIKYPNGTRVGDIDPHLRRGHGLLLSQDPEAIAVAAEAFKEVATFMDENGETLPLFTSPVKADLRSVYLVAMDKTIYEGCAKEVGEGTVWEYIHLRYDLPPLDGLEIEKAMNSEGNPDTKIVVLRLNSDWEHKCDAIGGGAGRDIHFRAMVGVITLKKRRAGPRPPPGTQGGAAGAPPPTGSAPGAGSSASAGPPPNGPTPSTSGANNIPPPPPPPASGGHRTHNIGGKSVAETVVQSPLFGGAYRTSAPRPDHSRGRAYGGGVLFGSRPGGGRGGSHYAAAAAPQRGEPEKNPLLSPVPETRVEMTEEEIHKATVDEANMTVDDEDQLLYDDDDQMNMNEDTAKLGGATSAAQDEAENYFST